MSQRDLQKNKATLLGFMGRRCFASLHAEAIRIRFDDPKKKGCYIWIDHPWVFSSEAEEITNSNEYSEDTFEEWGGLISALRETIFTGFEEGAHGEVTLMFSGGYRLFVPLDPESDDLDSGYDHWYAYDA